MNLPKARLIAFEQCLSQVTSTCQSILSMRTLATVVDGGRYRWSRVELWRDWAMTGVLAAAQVAARAIPQAISLCRGRCCTDRAKGTAICMTGRIGAQGTSRDVITPPAR